MQGKIYFSIISTSGIVSSKFRGEGGGGAKLDQILTNQFKMAVKTKKLAI